MKRFRSFLILLLTVSALAVGCVFSTEAVSGAKAVTTAPVNIRKGPSSANGVAATVPKKTTLTVLSSRKSNKAWYKVILKSGVEGYVHKDYIKFKSNQLLIPESGTGYSGYSLTIKNIINTTKKNIKWTSSDKEIAEADKNGTITCHKTGTVNIKAKAGKKTSVCTLRIKGASVKFEKNSYTMYSDDTMTVTAQCPKSVTYKSSDHKIATVSEKGEVTPKKEGTVKITATSNSGLSDSYNLTIKKRVITLALSDSNIYAGCRARAIARGGKSYKYKSSDTSVATVSSSGIITAKSAGKAKITASYGDVKASEMVKVKKGESVNISLDSDTVKKGMTLVIKSTTPGVKWQSTDTSVATVQNGYVLAKKKGTVIIRACVSGGASDCVVKVKDAEPVKFVYTSENSALQEQEIKFYAITDNTRTNVRFKITSPDGEKHWLYYPERSNDGNGYIWTSSRAFSDAGFYKIEAYSHTSADKTWKTCEGGEGTFYVSKYKNRTSCHKGERLVTTKVLNHIATYEGYVPKVEEDPLVANSPTVGYGRVVYSGTTFYNGLTKKEAFAYLVKTLNESAYTTRINAVLKDKKISFNQNHFDALVDFSYNLGAYAITNHSELINTLTNTYGKASYKNTGYINKPSIALRKKPDSSADKITTVRAATYVKIGSKTYNESWYKVKTPDGVKGYIKKNQVTKRSDNTKVRCLKNVPVQTYAVNFLKYHHASGICYKGLLYRRLDELEIFFFDDYANDAKKNEYGINFSCPKNPSFGF